MALIKCYECGKEISDKIKYCIKCGAPIKDKKNIKIHAAVCLIHTKNAGGRSRPQYFSTICKETTAPPFYRGSQFPSWRSRMIGQSTTP